MSIRVAFPAVTARTADSRPLSPIDPAKSSAVPDGKIARVASVPSRPFAARPTVPSPPIHPTTEAPSVAARRTRASRSAADSDSTISCSTPGRVQERDRPSRRPCPPCRGRRSGWPPRPSRARPSSPPARTRRRAPTAGGPAAGCPRRRRCCRTSSSPAGSATGRSRPPGSPVPRGRPPHPDGRSRRPPSSRRPRAIAGRWRCSSCAEVMTSVSAASNPWSLIVSVSANFSELLAASLSCPASVVMSLAVHAGIGALCEGVDGGRQRGGDLRRRGTLELCPRWTGSVPGWSSRPRSPAAAGPGRRPRPSRSGSCRGPPRPTSTSRRGTPRR